MLDINTILLPTDFSNHALYAQKSAMELAKKYDAKIVLVHVISATIYPDYAYGPAIPELELRINEAAMKSIEELADEIREESLNVETEILSGKPFVEIVQAANKYDADIIVIGTHGHGAITQALIGSTAERVVRKAPCPVLTIHLPKEDDQ